MGVVNTSRFLLGFIRDVTYRLKKADATHPWSFIVNDFGRGSERQRLGRKFLRYNARSSNSLHTSSRLLWKLGKHVNSVKPLSLCGEYPYTTNTPNARAHLRQPHLAAAIIRFEPTSDLRHRFLSQLLSDGSASLLKTDKRLLNSPSQLSHQWTGMFTSKLGQPSRQKLPWAM